MLLCASKQFTFAVCPADCIATIAKPWFNCLSIIIVAVAATFLSSYKGPFLERECRYQIEVYSRCLTVLRS
jgi:hypothetical protein